MRIRRRKNPFVLTVVVSAVFSGHACSSDGESDTSKGDSGAGTGATTATGGAGNSGGGGAGYPDASDATDADASGDATIDEFTDAPACPTTIPTYGPQSPCNAIGEICSYPVQCNSGTIEFKTTWCAEGYWAPLTLTCDKPWDACGSLHCYQGYWTSFGGTNPPNPCPSAPPTGACVPCCDPGGIPYDMSCGYPCDLDGGTGWTVATCESTLGWTYDGACPSADGGP